MPNHYVKTSPFGLFECIYVHVNIMLYKLNVNVYVENTLVIEKGLVTQQNSLIKWGLNVILCDITIDWK